MHFFRHLLLGSALLSLAHANPYQNPKEEVASVVSTGQQASTLLLESLGGKLKSELAQSGTIGAMNFCSHNAYELTQNVAKTLGSGVTIRRTSLKNRSSANAPTAEDTQVLHALQNLHDAGVALPEHLIKNVAEDHYRFYKPLFINKEVCLKCHGTLKDSATIDTLKRSYPQDKATGYALGDLRGVIVVDIAR